MPRRGAADDRVVPSFAMPVEMKLLTSVGGSFAARVMEARLQSEGIDVDLRGALDGPYGLTVGDMARVDVYVRTDQIDDARMVLLSDEVEAAFDGDAPVAVTAPPRRWPMWVALVLLLAAAIAPVVGYLVQR
jgi:hypothetical protein